MATDKSDEKGSPVPAILVLVGLLGVGGFIAVTNMTESSAATKLQNESVDLERPAKDLKLQQQGELVAPVAWADKAKGTATIPVDRAMDIVVKTLQANPAAATPPPPPPKPDADAGAEAGADGEAAATDGGAEAAATSDDAGAAATDAGAHAADAGKPSAPKPPPVAPKPPPAAPPAPPEAP